MKSHNPQFLSINPEAKNLILKNQKIICKRQQYLTVLSP